MNTVKIFTFDGKETGKMTLPEHVFNADVHQGALYETVKAYRAAQRQGNASAKGRGEVNKTKAKPFRQKGTGRARAGKASSPIWIGGGVTFGPKPRDYTMRVTRKLKRKAARSALTLKAREEVVSVVEDFTMEEPKTAKIANLISQIGLNGKKILFVLGGYDPTVVKSSRNIPRLNVIQAETVNAYEVLNADYLLFCRTAVDKVGEVLGR